MAVRCARDSIVNRDDGLCMHVMCLSVKTDDEYVDDVRALGVLIVQDDIISIEMDAC